MKKNMLLQLVLPPHRGNEVDTITASHSVISVSDRYEIVPRDAKMAHASVSFTAHLVVRPKRMMTLVPIHRMKLANCQRFGDVVASEAPCVSSRIP